MKTLLLTLALSGAMTCQASAFYFPGAVEWNDMFGNQNAREILNQGAIKVETKKQESGFFKHNSRVYLQGATASHEFLTSAEVGSYVTNVGRMLNEQTTGAGSAIAAGKLATIEVEIPVIYDYQQARKASAAALVRGEILQASYQPAAPKGFLQEVWELMQKKTSIPEGSERQYINLMDELGVN